MIIPEEDRFTQIICELEGIETPGRIRMRELAQLIARQTLDQEFMQKPSLTEIFRDIYGDWDEG